MIHYVDFPKIPDEIAQEALDFATEYVKNYKLTKGEPDAYFSKFVSLEFTDKVLGVPLEQGVLVYPDIAFFSLMEGPASLREWTAKNIPVNGNTNIQIMHGGNWTPPHIDELRRLSYNYLLTDDGASTVFYKPKDEYTDYTCGPYMIFPQDRLTLTEEIHIEPRRWHQFPSTVIHGVKHTPEFRASITIGIPM